MNPIKTLIHLHTDYSFDSNVSPEALAEFADVHHIGCLAVTDHDTIDGARHVQALTRAKVIVGEEVTTREGHLIGLFLQERVRPGMSARATALAIREQGGLVFVPHPFVSAFGCGLGKAVFDIVDLIDAVEVNNAQNLFARPDRQAARFAAEIGRPAYVGADSHDRNSIGPCFQTLADFNSPTGFLAALAEAELYAGRHSLGYFAAAAVRIARHYTGLGLPSEFGIHAQAEWSSPQFNLALAS